MGYGTLLFSSLVLISVSVVFSSEFWRYIAAAMVVKFIIMIELTGLRAVERESEQQNSDATTRQSL